MPTTSHPVLIYGRDACPFTRAARAAFERLGRQVRYINVAAEPEQLARMLALSGGYRKVPVIVDQGTVTIGFEGKF